MRWMMLVVLFGAPAFAQEVRLDAVRVVGRAAAGEPFTSGATEARLEDSPVLAVVGQGRVGKRRVVVADPDIAPLVFDGRRVPDAARVSWEALGPVAVRWATVEPHAWREEGAVSPHGVEASYHSNVSLERDSFGRWLGYDELTYFEAALGEPETGAKARTRPATVAPSDPTTVDLGGLGTVRFTVEVTLPSGRSLRAPGAEAVDRKGILPLVHRVSVRRDDTWLGWLSSYFHVPEVFGSSGGGADHQTDRFVGADCADVLTGALRARGHRVQHTHVAGLGRYARVVAGPAVLDADGRAEEPLTGVAEGDLVRIDYGGDLEGHTPRAWDHVAAVWEDRSDPEGPSKGGPDGQLDGFDLVVHMGHPRLVVEPLGRQCPARVDVMRWDPKRIGKPR